VWKFHRPRYAGKGLQFRHRGEIQRWLHRLGRPHVTAIQLLQERLVTGRFPGLQPAALRDRATSLGPELYAVVDNDTGEILSIPPGFDRYRPAEFLRADRFCG